MLTIEDIGSSWWTMMFRRTNETCFDESVYPAFPKDSRVLAFNEDIYVLPTDRCSEQCNGRGLCTVGRCTCWNGYYGDACQYTNCPNSLVYVDIDTIQTQE